MCRDLLSITHEYPQLIKTRHPVDDNDVEGFQTFSKIWEPPIPDHCVDLFLHILCLAATPPCGPDTGLPIFICEENCRLYKQVEETGICDAIQDRFSQLTMTSDVPDLFTLSRAYMEFDCSDPATYFFRDSFTKSDPNLCIHIFSPEVEGELRSDY